MKSISALLFILFFNACTAKKQYDFKGFDFEKWKSDRKGCKNLRLTQKDLLNTLKQDLKGISQNKVAELFGRPDAQILDERNKKVFIYYLQEGEQCLVENLKKSSNAETVAIRFNAVSLMIEMTFQKGNP